MEAAKSHSCPESLAELSSAQLAFLTYLEAAGTEGRAREECANQAYEILELDPKAVKELHTLGLIAMNAENRRWYFVNPSQLAWIHAKVLGASMEGGKAAVTLISYLEDPTETTIIAEMDSNSPTLRLELDENPLSLEQLNAHLKDRELPPFPIEEVRQRVLAVLRNLHSRPV